MFCADKFLVDDGLVSKHANALQETIMKKFLNGEYNVGKKCPHCLTQCRPIRSEYNSKVYFVQGVTRKMARDIVDKRQESRRQHADVTNAEEDAQQEVKTKSSGGCTYCDAL